MTAGGSDSFDIYLYQLTGATGDTPTRPRRRRAHRSRTAERKRRDRTAHRVKRRAGDFIVQAGELRKLSARLSTPENLLSPTVFRYFETLVPRLASIFQIAESFRDGFEKSRFPSGMEGLEFLLRVVKNLSRQIEVALAVAEMETDRCRRRPAYFDLHRLLEEASRSSRDHFLGGEVGLTVNRRQPLKVRGKRVLWLHALLDIICRAGEMSPRKGVAARLKKNANSVTLTLVPRGALVRSEDARHRDRQQQLLGRASPETDPVFQVIRRLVELLGGRVVVGKRYRSYITPLFTVEIPLRPDRAGG